MTDGCESGGSGGISHLPFQIYPSALPRTTVTGYINRLPCALASSWFSQQAAWARVWKEREKEVRILISQAPSLWGHLGLAGSFNWRAQLHQRSYLRAPSFPVLWSAPFPCLCKTGGGHKHLTQNSSLVQHHLYTLNLQKWSLTKLSSNYPFFDCHLFPARTL